MKRWAARALTAYTRSTPVARGKFRLAALARRLDPNLSRTMLAHARDGRVFEVDPYSTTYGPIHYLGEYEPGVTRVVRALVRPGDLCVDAGASIGWYATLMGQLSAGDSPSPPVHAFEPHPRAFQALTANVLRNELADRIIAVGAALGDQECESTLFEFGSLPEGHASLHHAHRADANPIRIRVTTLDEHLRRYSSPRVDLIKVDVEGAERMLFQGAQGVLAQARPPLLIVEMARATSLPFGYEPNALLSLIGVHAAYRFFRIDHATGCLRTLDRFGPGDPGSNVLCVPVGHFSDRLAGLATMTPTDAARTRRS